MQSGASVRKGLFAACEKLPDELALAFQIGGEPTEEQLAQMEAFAEKAEGLRSASVLLTARAKRQQATCAAIVGDVASYDKTIRAVKTADGEPFKPKNVTGATVAVCILAMQTAVKGIEHDLNTELHATDEAERQAAAKRMQARYDLLMRTHFPEGMKLSVMTSRFQLVMDEQAEELDRLRRQARDLPDGDATAAKRRLVEIAKEIERFLADGKYVDKALAVLAFKRQDSKGSAQKVWDRALDHAKLSTPDFALAREMMFKLFPQEIAGKGVRANIAESQLTVAAKKDFEAAKKSLDETTRAFGGQVRKALSDAVQIAVADTFLRSDPPLGSVAELRKQILAMPDQRALRESPFFRQCQKTLREKLAVPDSVSTNLLIQFFASMDDHVFQDMARGAGVQGAQSFLMDLSAADRAPVERLLHREDTLRRTSALVSSMTEPDAMVTFSLGMTRGTVRSAVAGRVFSGERRREQALEAGMTIRREGAEFVLTLSPYAAGNMGKRVAEALVKLENAAARAGTAFRERRKMRGIPGGPAERRAGDGQFPALFWDRFACKKRPLAGIPACQHRQLRSKRKLLRRPGQPYQTSGSRILSRIGGWRRAPHPRGDALRPQNGHRLVRRRGLRGRPHVLRRRSIAPGMPSSMRYFATVRRAMEIPFAFRMAAIRSSESGLFASSAAMRSRICCWTDVLEMASPDSVARPPVKNLRSSTVPNGVRMYLLRTVRETVVPCAGGHSSFVARRRPAARR